MKERPILFSAPMVRALLDGSKTQTRRIAPITSLSINPYEGDCVTWGVNFAKVVKGVIGSHSGGKFSDADARRIIAAQFNPYGKPGDRLWVREAWRTLDHFNALPPRDLDATHAGLIRYEADEDSPLFGFGKLRPSMFMPRWASRMTLDISGVRVERLSEISDEDCRAEGCSGGHGSIPGYAYSATPREHYRHVWESINGAGSWDVNPWLWVVEFKRASA